MTQEPKEARNQAVRLLAKSIFRLLQISGYDVLQIVTLCSELVGLVTSRIESDAEGLPE